VWRRGSVVASWLLDLTAIALAKSGKLEDFTGKVDDSGEGRWTVQAAVDESVAAPVITAALFARFRSPQRETPSAKSCFRPCARNSGAISKAPSPSTRRRTRTNEHAVPQTPRRRPAPLSSSAPMAT
jgi:6-phosphogluconate dehydrogenase